MTFGITVEPVGWDGNVLDLVFGLAIQGLIARPGNSLVGHDIVAWFIPIVLNGIGECIVKQGVGNEPAGIVRLLRVVVVAQRITRRAFDGVERNGLALELVGVQRLDIATMILKKIGQTIEEQDGRIEVAGDDKLQRAHGGVGGLEFGSMVRVGKASFDFTTTPLRHLPLCKIRRFERGGHFGRRDFSKRVGGGVARPQRRQRPTIRVVDDQFLHLQSMSETISHCPASTLSCSRTCALA